MKRRDFLKAIGGSAAVALLGGCSSTPQTESERPNILWLISADTSPDLGCYGHSLVKTPKLDQLAREGTLFTNAFATAPVGSASRSAFITGMYQTATGAHNHRSHRDDGYTLPAPAALVTESFRQGGYFICNCDGLNYKKPGRTDWNFAAPPGVFDGTDWSQRRPGQPFFAQVNFSRLQRPFRRDERNPIDPAEVELPPYYPDHPLARRDWADYLEAIQMLDTEIGVALTWLESERLAENTVVMYFADNGRPHVRGKQWLYEGGIRIPLIVRWPAHVEAGAITDDLVSSIDLAPTTMSLAGLKPAGHLQGYPFLGRGKKARRYVIAARDRCDGTVDRIRCVRSGRYKYIRNFYPDRPYTQFNTEKALHDPVLPLLRILNEQGKLTGDQARFLSPTRPPEELYDLQEETFELRNLADSEDHRATLREHSATLDEWIEATNDQGATPEPPEVLAHWRQQAATAYAQEMQTRGLSPAISDETYLDWWQHKLLP